MSRGKPPAAPAAIAFPVEELDTLLLGLALIDTSEDEAFEAIIDAARARIAAALPPEPPYRPRKTDTPKERVILGAIAAEQRLRLRYTDRAGTWTERVIWPIEQEGDRLVAWCETRGDIRHFRLDRMEGVAPTGMPMPVRRRVLRAAWLAREEEQGAWW